MNSSILTDSVFISVRSIFSSLLEDLRASKSELENRSHDEALHDVRVASRRLRTWLGVCIEEELVPVKKREEKQLKKVIRLTNTVRDLEVRLSLFKKKVEACIEAPIPTSLVQIMNKWQRKIDAGYESIVRQLPRMLDETESDLLKLIARLEDRKHTPSLSRQFRLFLTPVLERAALFLDESLFKTKSLEDEEEAHEARLLAKKFRYLLEPISKDMQSGSKFISEMKRFQDLLGDLRDETLLSRRLRKMIQRTGADLEAKKSLRTIIAHNEDSIQKLFKEFADSYLQQESVKFGTRIAAVVF